MQFVAHPNVQQLMASIWYEGLPGFRQKNMVLQVLRWLPVAIVAKIDVVRVLKFVVSAFYFHFSRYLTSSVPGPESQRWWGSLLSSSFATVPPTLYSYVSVRKDVQIGNEIFLNSLIERNAKSLTKIVHTFSSPYIGLSTDRRYNWVGFAIGHNQERLTSLGCRVWYSCVGHRYTQISDKLHVAHNFKVWYGAKSNNYGMLA